VNRVTTLAIALAVLPLLSACQSSPKEATGADTLSAEELEGQVVEITNMSNALVQITSANGIRTRLGQGGSAYLVIEGAPNIPNKPELLTIPSDGPRPLGDIVIAVIEGLDATVSLRRIPDSEVRLYLETLPDPQAD